MSSKRDEPSEEDILGIDLPAIRPTGKSGVKSFHGFYMDPPKGRAGRKLEAETSVTTYRIAKETEKALLIEEGVMQVGRYGFLLREQITWDMIVELAKRKRPAEVDMYLRQSLADLAGNLGDDLEAIRQAYVQKVLRELR